MSVLGKPRITTFLWFDANAEEAVDFYMSIFANSRKLTELRSNVDGIPTEKGKVLTIAFELDGAKFTAMNGGPGHPFTNAISLVVWCKSQAEIDHYWEKLQADGGKEIQCGWLSDRFGLCWQVVPVNIGELLKTPKAMMAMMGMKKLSIPELEAAGKA